MKGGFFAALTFVGLAVGLTLPGQADASCQSICVRLYNICLQSGESPAVCGAERDACFADCGSGGGIAMQKNDRSRSQPESCAWHAPQPQEKILPLPKRV